MPDETKPAEVTAPKVAPAAPTPTPTPAPKARLLLKNFPHIPDGYANEVPQEELDQLKVNRPDLYEEFQDAVDRFEHPEKYTREALDAAAKESVNAEVGGTK